MRQQIQTYTHVQETAATAWNINHNLRCLPVVDVIVEIDGVLQTILPLSTVHADNMNTVITFSEARSGTARLA